MKSLFWVKILKLGQSEPKTISRLVQFSFTSNPPSLSSVAHLKIFVCLPKTQGGWTFFMNLLVKLLLVVYLKILFVYKKTKKNKIEDGPFNSVTGQNTSGLYWVSLKINSKLFEDLGFDYHFQFQLRPLKKIISSWPK